MLTLLAQTEVAQATMPLWAQIGGGVLSLGFAVWYAWYTTTKTIPDLNTKHAETIKDMNASHTEATRELLREFRDESKEQRAAEHERAKVSAELARSGHAAMGNVVAAIGKLETTISALSKE